MMREEILAWFSAALSRVERSYFNLQTTYNQLGIVRERVFCYELYHQLRCIQTDHPRFAGLTLNGEIDKSGHPAFTSLPSNPDFVFHKPGQMDRNTCVVEVKGKLESSKVRKDFRTLLSFVAQFEYQFGLFIAYNESIEELARVIGPMFDSLPFKHKAQSVDILAIEQAHQAPAHTTLQRIVEEYSCAH